MNANKPSLLVMVTAGASALRRYPGLVVSLYGLQLVAAGLAGVIMASILAVFFAGEPMFDRAVAGDFHALVVIVSHHAEVLASLLWVGIGAVAVYMVLSWFAIGGLNATLIDAPTSRRDVTRTFGAGGAATFFAYLRLALLSLLPYLIALIVLAVGMARGARDVDEWLTMGDLLRSMVPALLPGVLLLWVSQTAIDYARLVLSNERGLASWRAFVRGYRLIFTDYRPLLHVLFYALVFVATTMVYAAATQGHAMAGAAGAIALFLIRQLVLGIRFSAKIACMAGQAAYLRSSSARPQGY